MFDLDLFKSYEDQWQALNRELDQIPRIPVYHMIMTLIILKKMEKLTRGYSDYLTKLEKK